METILSLNNAVAIASIFGAIAAWIALLPVLGSFFQRITGNLQKATLLENTYLQSLIADLEHQTSKNRWSDNFYIPIDTELKKVIQPYDIPPSFYIAKTIKRNLTESDFLSLSNVEKIDSSRGTSYRSLETALTHASDKAAVVIGPPGSGKTVSLRNYAIKIAKKRLQTRTDLIPIYVSLGYYTRFGRDGKVQEFSAFLDDYFSRPNYQNFLGNGKWKRLLAESKCFFFLDGIDELPRATGEYEDRSKSIENFIRSWPQAHFLLSCRELDYDYSLSFQQILIKPFDEKHIRSFLKKHFVGRKHSSILEQIKDTPGIFELCQNPFYLDLVCYFTRHAERIPENKAQLFKLIVDQLIEREKEKELIEGEKNKAQKNITISKEEFIGGISRLAHFLAVRKMATTISLAEYVATLSSGRRNRNRHSNRNDRRAIAIGIMAGILDLNENSDEVRFVHNRFLEYFSSLYILEQYKTDDSVIPGNFFTNIWWRETVLFVAGLDENADAVVKRILREYGTFSHDNSIIYRWLKLEMMLLSFDCIFSNLHRSSDDVYQTVKADLLARYSRSNTLEKVKILNSLKADTSDDVHEVIHEALDDSSMWVSETAFFIISGGVLRMRMSYKAILKEFGRFFVEGRLLEGLIPTIHASKKSRKLLLLLPVYLLLTALNILAVLIIIYVLFAFFRHVAFRMEFALTTECLGCLTSLSFATYLILFYLIRNDYPILKRFLVVSPLAIMVYYLVFSIPSNLWLRLVMIGMGLTSVWIYNRYFKKPLEDGFSLGRVSAFVFGYSILVPILNADATQYFLEDLGITGDRWSLLIEDYIVRLPILISSLSILLITIGAIIGIILKEAILIRKLNTYKEKLRQLINQLDNKPNSITTENQTEDTWGELIRSLNEMLNKLHATWAQNSLLKDLGQNLDKCVTISDEEKITLLNSLAVNTSNQMATDSIYQLLDERGKAYRRGLR